MLTLPAGTVLSQAPAGLPGPAELLMVLGPFAAYGALLCLVVLESVLVVGAFVPTLSLMLCVGFLAHAKMLDLPLVIGCATVGVVTGDLLAQRTGRGLGHEVRKCRLRRRVPAAARDRAWQVVQRWGGPALLVCRFVPLLRTFAPHVAGASRLRYRHLAPYSLIAGLTWASAEAGAGISRRLVRPAARGRPGCGRDSSDEHRRGHRTRCSRRTPPPRPPVGDASRAGDAEAEPVSASRPRRVRRRHGGWRPETAQLVSGVEAHLVQEKATHVGVDLKCLAPASAAGAFLTTNRNGG
nr:DedA family protein [Streptomyces alanosinicus]